MPCGRTIVADEIMTHGHPISRPEAAAEVRMHVVHAFEN